MAYRIYQFSCEFIKRGHEVFILAASFSHLRYINPRVKSTFTDEIIDGIHYKWIKTPSYNGNGFKRVMHIFLYNLKLWIYAGRIAKEINPDVVIASGVTPLDFSGCYRIARKANAKIIYEVGDLWPLTPIELGGYSKYHPFIIVMQWAENYAYKHCDSVISLLPNSLNYMVLHGLTSEKFNYIPNGINIDEWENKEDIPFEYESIIKMLKLQGKTLVAYTGSHGVANALDCLIDVANLLKNEDIVFFLVGSGSEKENLKRKANILQLNNLYFLDPISKKSIPSFLEMIDILYIGLKRQPLFRFGISPNKLFDYMMAGKPIVQAIDAGNNIVKDANCGVYVEPENVEEISSAILKIKSLAHEEREQMGNNGKEYVIEKHSYNILVNNFLNVIKKVCQGK
ncbi:MAG TPA: glycosyltransferase family 4 protein [Bacteroidales bacterium]|nr:glycosyltransferase family 4 protein [Bacteroidales bacterium]HOU95416.1 glycosyltransferase family 4 protein [Bacteroidales bacterium]HQG36305.1 glycosyltransferase family 4 protein [Bacteroidales bacterium]HQG52511.1 glycosyltransferase family 4 protein [Bacteroidales bacterium]HQJ20062.1 glycosyltransferase family 4 protein [Bacteroidales bacterium]